MPFDEEKPVAQKKGSVGVVKKTSSIFDNKEKKTSPQEFNEQVSKAEKLNTDTVNDIANAAVALSNLFKDKTLGVNKNKFTFSLENEIIQQFILLCGEKNNDQNSHFQAEGSLTGLTLLIKIMLDQKNRINELEYLVSQLKNK